MKKYLTPVLVILILVLVGYLALIGGFMDKKSILNAPARNDDSDTLTSGIPSKSSVVPDAETGKKENIIVFSGAGFSPALLVVKAGDTVIFKNEGTGEIWPASALHPTHNVYPVKGGCLGSIFDACRGLKKGELWFFKFDIPGVWGYHDHLNAALRGQVRVEM